MSVRIYCNGFFTFAYSERGYVWLCDRCGAKVKVVW